MVHCPAKRGGTERARAWSFVRGSSNLRDKIIASERGIMLAV